MDIAGIAVFAASGALVASRQQLDIVGFALVAVSPASAAARCGTCCWAVRRSSGCARRGGAVPCWPSVPAPC